MSAAEGRGNPRQARWKAALRDLGVVARAWWAPVALGVYSLWRLYKMTPGGNNDLPWLAMVIATVALALAVRRRVSPSEVMALQVLALALVADWLNWRGSGGLRDFHLYLNAGGNFVNNAAVYTTTVLHTTPKNGLDFLPYLYAPPTLPFFGLLSELPRRLADALWVAGSLAAVLVSLRAFGLKWHWVLLALIWTPIMQGLFVGNVMIPSLLLLAAATRVGGGLVFGPLFKPQNGIVSLWLVRERAWRPLVAGLFVLLLIVAATLPLTGLDLWRQWFESLAAYQQSQTYIPSLYGVGLGRYLPLWAFAAIAAFTVVAALWVSGREGLARLGLASAVASPSLFLHGFVFAIPSFLRLRAEWLWLVVGLTCIGPLPGPQIALAIGVAAWFVKGMARDVEAEQAAGPANRPLHPLGSVAEPWPAVEA